MSNEFLTAPRPIRTLLVANRGEIACRIFRTCRRLGIRTVAVYSEADRFALHVTMADQSVCVGPPAASESYLSIPAILAAASATGADSVHPGYGFLSENAAFVQACEDAGLVFVGPSADSVARMGSKVVARRLAQDAGVPIVPGFNDVGATVEDFKIAAERIGYPVMVKANAGGGGRGMRRVMTPDALEEAIDSARREASSSFGDSEVFLEKLIESPRHLEVQVFGDGQGGALHFYERDCSVQRNHQKVIEEAPAPNLPDSLRERLLAHAVRLTGSMRYEGAGTVEFIMDTTGDAPYFLEMNTRLQVEHPVTEEICGVDLVEMQLRQAAGLALGISQDTIVPKGHSIEVRLNAERPEEGFLPGTGALTSVATPEGIRMDSGVSAGSEVGSSYDSMLAKLIAHGPDREAARTRLVAGLQNLVMTGVSTNQRFLIDCLNASDFVEGRATTAFLEDNFPNGWNPDKAELARLRAAAALGASRTPSDDPLKRFDGFRATRGRRPSTATFLVTDDYGEEEVRITFSDPPTVEIGGEAQIVDEAQIVPDGSMIHAAGGGLSIRTIVRNAAEATLGRNAEAASEGAVAAPLAGLVTAIHVVEGSDVSAGERLLEMEAMKLVHTLKAPFDGKVLRIVPATGETVTAKTVLIEIERRT